MRAAISIGTFERSMKTEGTPVPQNDWSPARDWRSPSASSPMASRTADTANSRVSGMEAAL